MKSILYVLLVGCAVDTSSVTSAVNDDPGATSLSFHSPTGLDIEMRSVTPANHGDPIYLKIGGITGEQKDDASFRGVPDDKASAEQVSAAFVPIVASLVGLADPAQVSEQTGIDFTKVEVQYGSQPPDCNTAVATVKLAATYAYLKAGPAAGALADAYVGNLGVGPCPKKVP